jgi:elongation factor G
VNARNRRARTPRLAMLWREACSPSEPFSALVFKTVVDPFVGKLSVFKVKSGELTTGGTVYNPNKDKAEKINNLYLLRGKKQITR